MRLMPDATATLCRSKTLDVQIILENPITSSKPTSDTTHTPHSILRPGPMLLSSPHIERVSLTEGVVAIVVKACA